MLRFSALNFPLMYSMDIRGKILTEYSSMSQMWNSKMKYSENLNKPNRDGGLDGDSGFNNIIKNGTLFCLHTGKCTVSVNQDFSNFSCMFLNLNTFFQFVPIY